MRLEAILRGIFNAENILVIAYLEIARSRLFLFLENGKEEVSIRRRRSEALELSKNKVDAFSNTIRSNNEGFNERMIIRYWGLSQACTIQYQEGGSVDGVEWGAPHGQRLDAGMLYSG